MRPYTFKEEIANTAGDGSRVAGLDNEPPGKKKKEINRRVDGRTKEFKEKVKSIEASRLKRERLKLEKRYGIKLR